MGKKQLRVTVDGWLSDQGRADLLEVLRREDCDDVELEEIDESDDADLVERARRQRVEIEDLEGINASLYGMRRKG